MAEVIAVAPAPPVYAKAAASIPDSVGVLMTGVTVMLRVTVLLSNTPSLTVKLTVRVKALGFWLVFWYVTARKAA